MYKKNYYNFTKLFKFKFRTALKNNFLSYEANNNLDKKLQRYIDYYDGYSVELRANDGINQSNTFFFEKKRNWKGVLIESNEFKKIRFFLKKKNYSLESHFGEIDYLFKLKGSNLL